MSFTILAHSTAATSAARQHTVQPLSRVLVWTMLAFMVSWFALLDARPLFNPDEGRYAEIPREMLATGDWLVPRLNGLVYIEKPPLQYWATAASFGFFGEDEWTARLYTGLCGFLTVLVTAGLAHRLWGRDAAWRAGIMAGSSLLVVLMGHVLTLDMSLTLFMTLTLAGFCLAQHHRAEPARSRVWIWIAWASAALAVLTKGFVAVVLPALTLVGYSILQRDWTAWRRLSIPAGLLLFLLIAAPWFVLIQRELPQFFDFFFIREHLARYLTRIADRYEPWWFFGPILAAGCLPWGLPAARALFSGWRSIVPPGEFDARRLFWVWSVVVFLFFSASDSKLIPYILPMFPALALLMASSDESRLRRDLYVTGLGLIVAGIAFLAVAAVLPYLLRNSVRAPFLLGLRTPVLLMGLMALAAGISVRRLRGDSLSLTAVVGAAGYICLAVLLWGASAVAPVYSGAPLVGRLPHSLTEDAPIYSVRTFDHTLPFYLRRTVTLVDTRGELDFGLTLEPHKGIASLEAFESRWRSSPQALAVMEPRTYAELERRGLPMVVEARGLRRLIVSRQ